MMSCRRSLLLLLVLGAAIYPARATVSLTLCCSKDNDLHHVLTRSGIGHARFGSVDEAIASAPEKSALLILADGYPDSRTQIKPEQFRDIQTRQLRVYIEYPDTLPGVELGHVAQTKWERAVVAGAEFEPDVAPLTILTVSGCRYITTTGTAPLLAVARVAGSSKAVFGLPASARSLLFRHPESNALVATTRLSSVVTGRYGPAMEWKKLWSVILKQLTGSDVGPLKWEAVVRPRWGRAEALPDDHERQVLADAAEWVFRSRLLLGRSQFEQVRKLLLQGAEEIDFGAAPLSVEASGEHGILEGYSSWIDVDGRQKPRLPLRADCQAETAMMLAAGAISDAAGADPRTTITAAHLLDYVYKTSGMCGGKRGDPASASYGLIGWGAIAPSWEVANYGDDNGRTILATLAAGAWCRSDRWLDDALRAIAANFRTTGRKGFRGDRIDQPELEARGWKSYYEGEPVNLSPHFESALWACYLWAYDRTGHRPLLDRTKIAIAETMKAYPSGWRWGDNMERARMLLALAWLVRIEDTPEHRQWLSQVTDDLLQHQDASGAIPDRLAGKGGGHYVVPASNEAFGTGESPLIQENGDPISDQLYTTGFALLAFREAFAATAEPKYRTAEDRLAEYLCRIQIHSDHLPELHGAWTRAFDFGRWDYWASSGDIGWGPWCVEAGWGQSWIVATLALRHQNKSLWELLTAQPLTERWAPIARQMLP